MTAHRVSPIRILYVCSFLSLHSRVLVEFFATRPDEFEVIVLSSDGGLDMPGVRLLTADARGNTRPPSRLTWIAQRWMPRLPVPDWIWRRFTDYRYRAQAKALEARVRAAIEEYSPDIVHALRIQPEGLGAAVVKDVRPDVPFFLELWGLDLILMAELSSKMRRAAERTIRATDFLTPDSARDVRIARESFGLRPEARTQVLVTHGLNPEEFDDETPVAQPLSGDPTLVCMRGYENLYVRIEVLIQALAIFRERHPGARLYLCAHADFVESSRDRVIADWARKHGLGDAVEVLHRPRRELFGLLRRADLYVSATHADGVPISLLEGLYLGLVPVVFDHESTRDLLKTAQTGVTFDQIDARSIAAAWERAMPLLPNRAARTERNRQALAAEYFREPNLKALANLYREAVPAVRSTSRNRSSSPAVA